MKRFKDTMVAKGSALHEALEKGDKKLAEKIYTETTERYKQMHSEEDRNWFSSHMKKV